MDSGMKKMRLESIEMKAKTMMGLKYYDMVWKSIDGTITYNIQIDEIDYKDVDNIITLEYLIEKYG